MAVPSRHGARRLLMQALYQMQLTGHSAAELADQFAADPQAKGVDMEYFGNLLTLVDGSRADLDEIISRFGDIPADRLDPVEHAILWISLAELRDLKDLPPKVIINEAIELAKSFGAEGGYKFINGLLDKARSELR